MRGTDKELFIFMFKAATDRECPLESKLAGFGERPVLAELGSLASANDSPLPLHSRHQQTNVERSQRVDCVIHRLTQQTFGQL